MIEKKYLIAINKFIKIGPKRLGLLLNFFDSPEQIWCAKKEDFVKAGIEDGLAKELIVHIKNTDPDKEVEKLKKLSVNVLTLEDADYPENLKNIYLPPRIIYIRGEIKEEDGYAISIVGSRKATDYGRQITKDFASDLVLKGITIVSGLALGVDTAAHEAALSAGGRTIAVSGCGVEKPYPPSNANLAEKIIKNGAIISEFPIGTPPLRQNFPARNRIISGLSLGTLVTEAHEGSGSLITAGYTLEQNREVFAVPGSLYNKNSIGPNNLIKMGAKAVTSADDILEEMGWENAEANSEAKKIFPSSPEEEVVLGILENEPAHIDLIIKESGFESSQASSVLTIMEVKGKIKHMGGMVYRINN